MKRMLALFLVCALALFGCVKTSIPNAPTQTDNAVTEITALASPSSTETTAVGTSLAKESSEAESIALEFHNIIPEFNGLGDPELLRYTEDKVYTELIANIGDSDYFIENVSAVYISNEYLEEIAYNSASNIFFGYSLEELSEAFVNERYIFTLDADGTTVVRAFEDYDDTFQQVIKNVAIGSGVILVCVTVSAVLSAGAPAVSLIFAASAKTGATFALSSGTIGFAASSIITGIQTNNIEQAIKAGALSGSEGFMWGAISGAIAGGATESLKYAKAITALKGTTLNGISTQQAAVIQMESGYPIHIIKQFQSMEEYRVFRGAGLVSKIVDGKIALVRKIDLKYTSELGGKTVTNIERMKLGYAPIDPSTKKAYQLHHIGQKNAATLAILTETEHQGNSAILNMIGKESEIDRPAFDLIRKKFWESFAEALS